MTQRLLVLVNQDAGTTDDGVVRTAVARLREGADVEVTTTGGEDDLLRAVAGRGDRRLVVVGGDGSVHRAVAALDRAGGLDPADPLGIVPAGTANVLARVLGLPLDPAAGAAVVLTGRPRPLDLLRDDGGGLVLNAVHAGLGPRAAVEATRFKRLLGWAAFPVGAVVAGIGSGGWRLRVEVDGEAVRHPTAGWAADGSTPLLLAAVCNGPTIGRATPLAPDARLDDGIAEVVVSAATGPLARAAFGVALLRGRHDRRADVVVARGERVAFSGAPVELDADGEVSGPVASRSWRLEHAAWSVLAPA